MKLHRVFIAINIPENVKEELLSYKDMWPDVPAKWTAKENLHITLAFLGNRSDKELSETYELLKKIGLPAGEAGERHKPFLLTTKSIVYGPNADNPRMIWALLKESQDLLALQQDLLKSLGQASPPTIQENNLFSPHLTLAKLSAIRFQQMELEELPEIHEEISLSFTVNSIEIMESEPKRSGSSYTVFKSIPL